MLKENFKNALNDLFKGGYNKIKYNPTKDQYRAIMDYIEAFDDSLARAYHEKMDLSFYVLEENEDYLFLLDIFKKTILRRKVKYKQNRRHVNIENSDCRIY